MATMDTVRIVAPADLARLEQLWRDIAREEHPDDPDAEERAARGSRRSRSEFDYLDTDSFWIFASEAEHRYAGYASASRIPKADARVGFLYIDELYVLQNHRRLGHATRILEMAVTHAGNLRLAGVRLLVDPANTAARRLYDRLGFVERNQVFCERRIDRG
jgi:ribosomal protein S18 acetylase RimI-like enzyme